MKYLEGWLRNQERPVCHWVSVPLRAWVRKQPEIQWQNSKNTQLTPPPLPVCFEEKDSTVIIPICWGSSGRRGRSGSIASTMSQPSFLWSASASTTKFWQRWANFLANKQEIWRLFLFHRVLVGTAAPIIFTSRRILCTRHLCQTSSLKHPFTTGL